MSDVAEFEELLAALDDEPSKASLQTNQGLAPSIRTGHQNLPQIHGSSALPVLQDQISFDALDQHSLQLGHDQHMGGSQIMQGLDQGLRHMQRNDILGSNVIEDSFSGHVEQQDQSAVQAGSSLGSLFLDSVDEMLSNEKTNVPAFVSPSAQSAATKPPRPKSKKPAPRKGDILQPQSGIIMDQTTNSPQQVIGGANSTLKADEQVMMRGQSGNAFNTGSRVPAAIGTGQEAFTRPSYRQQVVQLTRQQSNASCDSPYYPGSVPQPSPCGSADSNLAPRTPLSNNPLTPQSAHRPTTPQSSQLLVQQTNRSNVSNPSSQLQQHSLLNDSSFLQMDQTHSPPPVIPDDQSHLQYLNTTASVPRTNTAEMSGTESLLDDFQHSSKSIFQDKYSMHDFSSFDIPSTMSSQPVPDLRPTWPQSQSISSSIGSTIQLDSFNSFAQSQPISTSGFTPSAQQGYSTMHPSASVQNFPSSTFVATTGNNRTAVTSYSRDKRTNLPSSNYGIGISEGLTLSQSQLLGNPSAWGKSKPTMQQVSKPDVAQLPQSHANQLLPSREVSYSQSTYQHQQPKTSKENLLGNSRLNTEQGHNTVLSMLSSAATGIKQIINQPSGYEDMSPISDYSPVCKDPPDATLNENLTRNAAVSLGSQGQFGIGLPKLTSQSRTREDAIKVGPLARRRSASTERKQTKSTPKKSDSGDFNFVDDGEFDFDQSEPTIRLPTKRADNNENAGAKPSNSSETAKPILAQAIQRKHYTDPTVFDSVQELAMLKQKNQSLMEKLSSQTMKTPKPMRVSQKTTMPSKVPNTSSQINIDKRTVATAAGKPSKPRKPSKSDTAKDEAIRPPAKVLSNQISKGRGQKQKFSKADDVSNDHNLFYQQFLSDTAGSANAGTSVSEKSTFSQVPLTTSSFATSLSLPMSASFQHKRSAQQDLLGIASTSSSQSPNIGKGFEIPMRYSSPSNMSSNKSSSMTATSLPLSHPSLSNECTNAEKILCTSENTLAQYSKTPYSQLSKSIPNTITSSSFNKKSALGGQAVVSQSALFSFPGMPKSVSQGAPNTTYQPSTALDKKTLMEIYSNSLSKGNQAVFTRRPKDPLSHENQFKTITTASRAPAVTSPQIFSTKSTTPAVVCAARPSSTTKSDGKLSSTKNNTQQSLEFLNSLLAKQPSFGATGNTSTTSALARAVNSKQAHSISSASISKSASDRYPVLPDMSQIQVDYATSLPLTTSVTAAAATAVTTQAIPSTNTSASWSFVSPVLPPVSARLSNDGILNSPTKFSTAPLKSSSVIDAATSGSKKQDSESSSHAISHLPDSISAQFLPGMKHTEMPPVYGFPPGHDALGLAGYLNTSVPYVGSANRFPSASMPAGQAAVQHSLDILRMTQQRFEMHPGNAHFPPSSHFPSNTSTSVSATVDAVALSSKSTSLPTYQQSIDSRHSHMLHQQRGSFEKTVNTKTTPDTPAEVPVSLISKQSSALVEKAINASPSISTPSVKYTAPVPLDFSSKSPSISKTNTSSNSKTLQTNVTSTKTTNSEQSSLTSTTNILKDKTYHGPKKKHILEKYSQQIQNPPLLSTNNSKDLPLSKSAEIRTGFGKTRKPSTDKSTPPQTRNRSLFASRTDQSKASSSKNPGKSPAPSDKQNMPFSVTSVTAQASANGKVVSNDAPKKSSNKDEQSGPSIFSLFDSLLEEATESAKDSLKNEQVKKKDVNQAKITKDIEKDKGNKKEANQAKEVEKDNTKQTTKKTVEKSQTEDVVLTESLVNLSDKVTAAESKTNKSTTVPSTVTATFAVVTSSLSNTVASRTPANFPFKRRHFHTQSKASVPLDTPKVDLASTVTSVVTVSQSSITTAPITVTSTTTSTPLPVSKVAVPPVSLIATPSLPIKLPNLPPWPVDVGSPSTKSGGLRLKITAFRSAGGKVIHQSTALGDLDDDDLDSGDLKLFKKKKKYKKKKRHRHSVSSSSSISRSSPIPIPMILPSTGSKLPSSDENDVAMYSNVQDRLPTPVYSSVDSDAGSGSASNSKKRKKKISKSLLQPALKRHHASGAANADIETEKPKKQNKPAAKKPVKPVPRYKLKSSQSQVPLTKDEAVVMPFNRASGKPPNYLNNGARPSLISGNSQSVPTIQLAPRSAAKTTSKSTVSSVTSQSAAKLLSVKLSSTTVKTVQAHALPNTTLSGVRYILQKTPPNSNVPISPRIIIPKLSSPSFSVGKATVFTVSSSGARVSGTPTIQIQHTPVQSSSAVPFSSVVSPTQPIFVKRVPVSLLPKVTVSSSALRKVSEASAPSTVASTAPTILSFTSKPVQVSSKVIAPKPFLSPSSRSTSLKIAREERAPIIPVIVEAPECASMNSSSKRSKEHEFQSAFSKLISSPNPLNKYTPPPVPPQYIELLEGNELKTEQCYECGDSFYFHRSLKHHYDRRSIIVKVRCVQCNQMLVFFNKCEILRHAREHSDQGEVMQFNGANLTPIPLSLCKCRSKEYFLKAAQERLDSPRKSTDMKTTGCAMACTECSFVTDGSSSLEDHFQRRNAELRACDICKLPLHNQCVFSAHMRMHRHAPPHTCPECGQTFDGNKMDFNLHLRIQCFHLSRASCYKCKLCNLTFLTDDQLRHHLRLNHVQVFYKCRECPMAFKTTQNIANHQRSAHNLTPEPTNTLKTIYKCPLCDTVFTDSSHSQQLFVLHKHFDGHINSTRITAYKCYLCTSLFEQKAPLREHLQNEHKLSSLSEVAACTADVSVEQPKSCQQPVHAEEESKAISESKKPSKAIKRPNKDKNHRENSTSPRIKIKRLKSNGPSDSVKNSSTEDKRAKQPFKIRIKGMSSGPSVAHLSSSDDDLEKTKDPPPKRKLTVIKTAQGKKTYPCPECEKVFMSSHSRSSHIRSIHRGIRALYCCTHCSVGSTKFAKRVSLVKHLKKVHSISKAEKADIKIIRTQMQHLSPGMKFKASSVTVDKDGVVTPEKRSPSTNTVVSSMFRSGRAKTLPPPALHSEKLPRKKITSKNPAQARARRLVAAVGRMRKLQIKRGRRSSDESEESYGEVDEKTVEEGWGFEEPEPNKDNEEIGEVDASMFNFPKIYSCIKCDFQHGDRLVFQDHITEHSQSSDAASALTMVQCTECGLCFASSASLDKHMHIKHKIKQRNLLERYDAKLRKEREDVPLVSASVDLGSSGVNVFRCKVCFHKFDTDTELKTHMRTHGLAFVKSKQH